MEVLQITILLGLIFFSAAIDAEQLNSFYYIYNHSNRFMQRLFFIIAVSFIGLEYYNMIDLLINFIGCSLIFAGLFDKVLNYLRDLPMFYLGKTAKWDKFWQKRKTLYKYSTVLLIMLGFYLLIKY